MSFTSSYNGLGKSQLPKTALFSASDLSKQDASNFVFGEQTSIFGSCSASLYGELFVLGGTVKLYEILSLITTSINTLPYLI